INEIQSFNGELLLFKNEKDFSFLCRPKNLFNSIQNEILKKSNPQCKMKNNERNYLVVNLENGLEFNFPINFGIFASKIKDQVENEKLDLSLLRKEINEVNAKESEFSSLGLLINSYIFGKDYLKNREIKLKSIINLPFIKT